MSYHGSPGEPGPPGISDIDYSFLDGLIQPQVRVDRIEFEHSTGMGSGHFDRAARAYWGDVYVGEVREIVQERNALHGTLNGNRYFCERDVQIIYPTRQTESGNEGGMRAVRRERNLDIEIPLDLFEDDYLATLAESLKQSGKENLLEKLATIDSKKETGKPKLELPYGLDADAIRQTKLPSQSFWLLDNKSSVPISFELSSREEGIDLYISSDEIGLDVEPKFVSFKEFNDILNRSNLSVASDPLIDEAMSDLIFKAVETCYRNNIPVLPEGFGLNFHKGEGVLYTLDNEPIMYFTNCMLCKMADNAYFGLLAKTPYLFDALDNEGEKIFVYKTRDGFAFETKVFLDSISTNQLFYLFHTMKIDEFEKMELFSIRDIAIKADDIENAFEEIKVYHNKIAFVASQLEKVNLEREAKKWIVKYKEGQEDELAS